MTLFQWAVSRACLWFSDIARSTIIWICKIKDTSILDYIELQQYIYYIGYCNCSTKYGMYQPNCGLDNLLMSWGHDEYLYQVLKNHPTCTLPEEAMYMIRFHSFYPWHNGGDYWYLANDTDRKMFYWIREFK